MSRLKTFNQQLADLTEKLHESFPKNEYINKLHLAVALTMSPIGNPFRLMVEFYNHVYIPHGNRLMTAKSVEDCESFFMQPAFTSMVTEAHATDETTASNVVNIIDTLKSMWNQLDASEKKSMFSYLKALLLLTKLHIADKGLLNGMSSATPKSYPEPARPEKRKREEKEDDPEETGPAVVPSIKTEADSSS
jgi:hypothetical protein